MSAYQTVLDDYLTESFGLNSVTPDSIARFSAKVESFVTRYPEAKDDPAYTEIQQNIGYANLGVTILPPSEWEDDEDIEF